MNASKIIIALDNSDLKKTINLVNKTKNKVFAFKIGYEFFFNFGINGYKSIKDEGVNIFLDLKLHDIPNTVKKGIEAIAKLEPYFTTIHISGGDDMQIASSFEKKNTKILGVSVLTSLNSHQVEKYYYNDNIKNIITDFTNYAVRNKLDGIVCSPQEIELIKKITSNDFIIVTPGIRPRNYFDSEDDQKRTTEPKTAIDLGADYIVIGRPITNSLNPVEVINLINSSIE